MEGGGGEGGFIQKNDAKGLAGRFAAGQWVDRVGQIGRGIGGARGLGRFGFAAGQWIEWVAHAGGGAGGGFVS